MTQWKMVRRSPALSVAVELRDRASGAVHDNLFPHMHRVQPTHTRTHTHNNYHTYFAFHLAVSFPARHVPTVS